MPEHALSAYFSMAVALENQIPTYRRSRGSDGTECAESSSGR